VPAPECVKGGKVPKFKNTRPFPRNTTLYNYDVASAYDSVVVVESPMSVLYLMSHWTDRVVATFGGHVSARQARLLYGFGDGVYLWPDNDPTGSDVFMESVGLLAPTVPVYLVPLVAGEKADPGDCPPDQIQDYLDAAIPSWALTTLDGYPVGP